MSTTTDILAQAIQLPQDQRLELAAGILDTLPNPMQETEDGLAEAKRRSEEMDNDPSASTTWNEIKAGLGR